MKYSREYVYEIYVIGPMKSSLGQNILFGTLMYLRNDIFFLALTKS